MLVRMRPDRAREANFNIYPTELTLLRRTTYKDVAQWANKYTNYSFSLLIMYGSS
jgi:hypothetical protein